MLKDPVKKRQNLEWSILLIIFITMIHGRTIYTMRLLPTYATVFLNLWHIISFKTTCKRLYYILWTTPKHSTSIIKQWMSEIVRRKQWQKYLFTDWK
jgi:hypothetical protein